ncbi:MAG TPA: MEDS domain-containing protein [Gemmatimonadales bacterium]|nr:MEDS domain-containing protein [Gemmatimonadales bacterium]
MSLLAEAPPGRHFAQFHRDTLGQDRRRDTLTESALAFVAAGLRRGENVVIIAGPDQQDRLFERLTGEFSPQSLRDSAQLSVLDAGRITGQFVAGGLPEWGPFRYALAPVLSRLQPSGRSTRVYSEIANALWQAGNTAAAIQVEDYWNALAATLQFSLYCGYTMDTQSEHSYAAPLEELGRTHSDILGTPEDEEFGVALDRASKEMFGIALTQMAGLSKQDETRRFPSGQRTMLWVKRNLPLSTSQLAERARHYFRDKHA